MGVQWCVSLMLWVLVGALVVRSLATVVEGGAPTDGGGACRIPGCKCTDAAKIWKIINCTFNSTQRVEFTPGSVSAKTMEVSITGGEEVVLQPQTFTSLDGLHLIRVDGTRRFIIRKSSFMDLISASLLLQVQGCERLVVETNAFKNTQTPISIEISRCSSVSIQNSAFSRLQEGKFHTISSMELAESAFYFENQGIIDRHGPVTTLSFNHVKMPKIPRATFRSSLAEVSFRSSEIDEVQSEAFRASQISAVTMIDSSVHKIKEGAFSDRTLLFEFRLSKCRIRLLESRAVMAAMQNLTVEHSKITEIERGAINSTVGRAVITDNEIGVFHSKGFIFNNWNRIYIDNNILKTIRSSFLEVPYNQNTQQIEFSFVGNEIYKTDNGALSFLPGLEYTRSSLRFDNNFFNETCRCDIERWVTDLLGTTNADVTFVLNTSFCTINALLSRCFELQEGLINMHNFTELVCGMEDSIKCEPYSGETKVLDTTTTLLGEEEEESNGGLILGVVLGAVLIIAVSGTIVILLIRGGLWLKRKGYCMRFRNMHYHQEQPSTEDEGTIVAIDTSDKMDVPEELTPEILQRLREQLEDPTTHEEAREMIERLYELFITGDSYTNNNRQDEEAHLYEELGNLQLPNQQNEKRQGENGDYNEPFGFLRMMEEKYNTTAAVVNGPKPALAGEYSEPTDAAVHLYSELQQNKSEDNSDGEKRDSLISFRSNTQRSTGSGKMAFRPLPEKPKNHLDPEPGPSKKY